MTAGCATGIRTWAGSSVTTWGVPGLAILVPTLFILEAVGFSVALIGFGTTLAGVTGLSVLVWAAALFAVVAVILWRGSLDATVAVAVAVGSINLVAVAGDLGDRLRERTTRRGPATAVTSPLTFDASILRADLRRGSCRVLRRTHRPDTPPRSSSPATRAGGTSWRATWPRCWSRWRSTSSSSWSSRPRSGRTCSPATPARR